MDNAEIELTPEQYAKLKADVELSKSDLECMKEWFWYKRANGGTVSESDKVLIDKMEKANGLMYEQAKKLTLGN